MGTAAYSFDRRIVNLGKHRENVEAYKRAESALCGHSEPQAEEFFLCCSPFCICWTECRQEQSTDYRSMGFTSTLLFFKFTGLTASGMLSAQKNALAAASTTTCLPDSIQTETKHFLPFYGFTTPRYLCSNSDFRPTICAEKRASGVGCGEICRMSAKLDAVQSGADRQRFVQIMEG